MVFQQEITLRPQSWGEMHDLTGPVTRIVRESGVRTGIVQIFNVGSTGAIGAIEFEPGLTQDLPALLRRLIPPGRDYAHEQTWHDGNGHSHLQATLLGPSLTVPVKAGPCSAPGSRSFTLNATSGPANGPSSSRCWANDTGRCPRRQLRLMELPGSNIQARGWHAA